MLMSDKTLWTKAHFLAMAIGLLVLAATLVPGLNAGGFWWTDETRHAMDGVFFKDFLTDRPVSDPIGYAEDYFARYPALGLNWYPPFFAVTEAGVFGVFGISDVSARLTVLLYGVLAVIAWIGWMRHFWDAKTLAFSCVLFLTNLTFVTWSQMVMLELPAVAMMLLAFWSYDSYLRSPGALKSILTGMLMGAAVLTKQTTLFIFPAFLIYPLLVGGYRPLFRPAALWAYLFITISIAFIVVHALKFSTFGLPFAGGGSQTGGPGFPGNMLLPLRAALDAFGYPTLIMATIGGIGSLFSKARSITLIIILWCFLAVFGFGQVTGAYNDLLRYSMYVAPAIYLLAASPLIWLMQSSWAQQTWTAALVALLVWQAYLLIPAYPPRHVSGYEKVADYIRAQPDAQPVLFCCKHDGLFTYRMRATNPERSDVILRADKILVSISSNKRYGVVEHARSDQEIIDALKTYGVRLLVLEDRDLVNVPQFERLIKLAQNSQVFEKLATFPIDTNVGEFSGVNVNVYRFLEAKPPENSMLIIPIPHLDREIRLDLSPKDDSAGADQTPK